jgi:diguanylate cyclase (GGDEF)-like protein
MLVGVVVPAFLGLPSLSAGGVLFCAALVICLRAVDTSPKTFQRAGHVACIAGLTNLAYAIFGFALPPEISVYYTAIMLLAAAQFLGVRAAGFWGIVGIALVATASFFPPEAEREVPTAITFVVRAAALMTVLAFAVSFRRSQDQQSAEFEIQATTDPLTGLANRRELDCKLSEALLRSRRFDRPGALIFVDLDRVKRVNDSFGHSAGDELIRIAAVRIGGVTRSVDTSARLGGDEFVILLSEFTEPKGGEVFGRRLLAALSEPIEVSGQLLKPSASIGVALFPAVGLNADDVLRAADDAMYQAKRAGGGRVFLRDGPDLREVV